MGVTNKPAEQRRVCVLTGAGGKLGTAFCRLYANAYDIVAVYRSHPPQVPTQSQRLVDPLQPDHALAENQHPVYAVQADLNSESDITRIVDIALARFNRVDLLVNNAVSVVSGSMIDSTKLLETAGSQFQVNVLAPLTLGVHLAQLFWRDRKDENVARNRNIVNVSSVSGTSVFPNTGHSLYAASKAALNHLTRYMALEFGEMGIRVNALAPTSFPSLIPTERVAQGIRELDQGSATGGILVLDAGRSKAAGR